MVLAELSGSLLPPVGGKTINVPQTGELAFVGFGSAVIAPNQNPGVQAKLELTAQKTAQMRARSALCGIILGDEIKVLSSLDAESQSLSKEFEEAQKADPLFGKQDQAGVKKLQEQRNTFLNTELSTEQITSIRNGTLPPGVTVKTYFNENKSIAEAVAVYLPSLSSQTGQAGREMRNSRIVPENGAQGSAGSGAQGGMPAQGPSGQVSDDAEL